MGIVPGSPIWPGGLFAGLDTLVLALLVVCTVALVGCALLLWRAGRPSVSAARGAGMGDEAEAEAPRIREQFVGPQS